MNELPRTFFCGTERRDLNWRSLVDAALVLLNEFDPMQRDVHRRYFQARL